MTNFVKRRFKVQSIGLGVALFCTLIGFMGTGVLPAMADRWTQTDWSSGPGQDVWQDTTKYQSDDGKVDVTSSPGNVKLSELPGLISESSFETLSNWTYDESDGDYNGEKSADWSTDGTYSYKFWSTETIQGGNRYCQISQSIDFTDIDTIYFDCKLWAEQNNKFTAYVLIDNTTIWQKAITIIATEHLNESTDVSSYTSNHYLRFRIEKAGGRTDNDQTNYFDNIRTSADGYDSSGTLTSSIYNATSYSKEWETMTWNDAGVQTFKFKVRTSNDSTMAVATDWSSCDYVTNGQDISSINSVTDGHIYIQYRVELSTTNSSETPILNEVIVYYTRHSDIDVSPDSFNITLCHGEVKNTTLVISNTGYSLLTWSMSENPSVGWLSESSTSDSTDPGDQDTVLVQFDATGLSTSTYKDTLVITSNDPDESTIEIPVQLTVNAANISVPPDSFNFTLYVDSTRDTTLVISNTGACALIWSLSENPPVDWLSANPASDTTNAGLQTKINLHFDATGLSPGNYEDTLVITSNDPDEPTLNVMVQLIVISSGYYISGYVKYWADSNAVENTKIILSEGATDTVLTGSTGYYIFSGLQGRLDYTVIPSKTNTGKDTSITPYDASLILDHVVEFDTLNENQEKAADVSDDSFVSSYDAALILRYVVDKISDFPAGDWGFVPDSINYISLNSNQSNQNYTAILYGDVSGNGPSSKSGALVSRLLQGDVFGKQQQRNGDNR